MYESPAKRVKTGKRKDIMNFCDECGGIIVPEKEDGETSYKCRNCGERYTAEDLGISITEKKEENEQSMIGEGDDESLPETDAECDECGNDKAHWWMEQTRAGDEPETRFFKCTECGNTWREYD